jgi:hypothetical protein
MQKGEIMSDYIKINFETLADGSAMILKTEKLRELDPEVKRLYEISNAPRITDSSIYDGKGNHQSLFSGNIVSWGEIKWIRDACVTASKRLAEIEEKVFRLRENPITETLVVTGFLEEKPKMISVLDCQHPDGKVYSWYVEPDDQTSYHSGDFVEVEHLGGYKNDYVKIVGFRYMMGDNPEFPACRVVGKA